ncbi:MAG: protein kinase [Prevotellaceae bacterium]|jgi:serine/threonine protein kinase|nr:protein kinase [Prevotellaceae bacterium]
MKILIYNVQDIPIGGGGMGEVYLGTDPQGRRVAIKKMRAELTADADLRAFFHKEVNTLTQLEHPFIVKVHASFEEWGSLYMVMEYVEGETIEQYVRRCGRIGENEAVRLFSDILSATGFVHQKGFVHRDIKPSNIIVKPDRNICLIDFGIVKDMNHSSGHTVTQIIGTDGYMSPEQAGAMNIDQRSDIYSLGCVLYYMLVGDHAIKKKSSDHDTRIAILQGVFPRAKDFNPVLSDHIQRILDKATDKNMLKRFQSCREFELEMNDCRTIVTDDNKASDAVSVGREGCDINFPPYEKKISRRHLDIIKKYNPQSTEKAFIIIRDRSTNGTVINGEKIHNSEKTINHWDVHDVKILLAGEVELKWADVEAALARKSNVTKPSVKDTSPTPPVPETEGQSAVGWLVAIYIFAALGGLLGLVFGISVYKAKLDLPGGGKVHKYKQSHRTAALIGAILSGVSMIVWNTIVTMNN